METNCCSKCAIFIILLVLKYRPDPQDFHKRTPLSYSAKHGHAEATRVLLKAGLLSHLSLSVYSMKRWIILRRSFKQKSIYHTTTQPHNHTTTHTYRYLFLHFDCMHVFFQERILIWKIIWNKPHCIKRRVSEHSIVFNWWLRYSLTHSIHSFLFQNSKLS
jgi:hypothetical protein